ncbi:MAG: FAD-binding oxidoreductase, partial [Candidatus Binataceae bacterium]
APLGAARTLAHLRASPVALGVSLRRMARIIAYEPEDMTVVAEAGLTLGALNDHMAARRQHLPLDPPDPPSITLGALIGAAKSGPLRLMEGTPRDLLIGIRFAGHGGRIVHGGGAVVKNVAGYDLMKVLTGSFGTLGIIIEATFKVRPLPERCTIARIECDKVDDAFSLAARIHDALALVHLDVVSPATAKSAGLTGGDHFVIAAGICGNRREIDYQIEKIAHLAGAAKLEILQLATALRSYRRLRDIQFPTPGIEALIATAPAALPRCVEACGGEFHAHAGSGIARLFAPGEIAACDARDLINRWRESARAARGHLRILAAPPALRGMLDIFDAPTPAALKLMTRLKQTFDPAGIFNPGCFVGGL